MPAMNDTHPEAERVQMELIRKMSPEQRAARASFMRNRTYLMARRAIAEARADWSEPRQKLLFIEVQYGVELARQVEAGWRRAGILNA